MESNHERSWDHVWSRRNMVSKFIHLGRRVYNRFFFRLVSRYVFKNMSFLEIGCGTSTLLLEIAPAIDRAVGLDISQNSLEISKANAQKKEITNVEFVKGDCRNLPYKEEFDFVWSQGLIEHYEDSEQLAREHFKATKTGGIALISVPYLYSYLYLWYVVTRPIVLRKFWPWPEQKFFTHRSLGEIGKSITANYKVFFLQPLFLGVILLEMRK